MYNNVVCKRMLPCNLLGIRKIQTPRQKVESGKSVTVFKKKISLLYKGAGALLLLCQHDTFTFRNHHRIFGIFL
jgi:hypothetical protein